MNVANALIAQMISTGSIVRWKHLMRDEYFDATTLKIYERVLTYEQKFEVCMTEYAFKQEFPDFVWEQTEFPVEYLAEALNGLYVTSQGKNVITDALAIIEDDPHFAVQASKDELQKLISAHGNVVAQASDIVANAVSRLESFRSRRIETGIAGITLGFDLLDEVCHGTHKGEVELWFGRPGRGKTLSLLYSVYKAFLSGKRVTFVSPEMTEEEIGLRLDSFMFHISQMSLLSGRASNDVFEAFSDSISTAKIFNHSNPGRIFFREAFKLGRKFNVDDLLRFIDVDQPDLIAIDGLMFIEPMVKVRDLRSKITETMDAIKNNATTTGIPFRIAHQANRKTSENKTGKRRKDMGPVDFLPELENLAEAGSTEQFANRVIACTYDSEAKMMFYGVRKNRNGPEGRIISAPIDIDVGAFGPDVIFDEKEMAEKAKEPVGLADRTNVF